MWRVNAGTGSARLPEEDVQEAGRNNPHMAPLVCVNGVKQGGGGGGGVRERSGGHKQRSRSRQGRKEIGKEDEELEDASL